VLLESVVASAGASCDCCISRENCAVGLAFGAHVSLTGFSPRRPPNAGDSANSGPGMDRSCNSALSRIVTDVKVSIALGKSAKMYAMECLHCCCNLLLVLARSQGFHMKVRSLLLCGCLV
jgi:hypothetical protein